MTAGTPTTVAAVDGEESPALDGGAIEARTVLLVDDEIIIRMLIADELRAAGYRVMQAGNADEALDLLHSGATPDLLITDIQMPGAHDGLALAGIALRAHPGMKIVIVSGALPTSHRLKPADAMIAKPYEPTVLLAAVAALLAPSAATNAATE